MQTKSHETKGVLYKHICSSCFANNGRTFPHSEVDCKGKKQAAFKNRLASNRPQPIHRSRVIYNVNVHKMKSSINFLLVVLLGVFDGLKYIPLIND